MHTHTSSFVHSFIRSHIIKIFGCQSFLRFALLLVSLFPSFLPSFFLSISFIQSFRHSFFSVSLFLFTNSIILNFKCGRIISEANTHTETAARKAKQKETFVFHICLGFCLIWFWIDVLWTCRFGEIHAFLIGSSVVCGELDDELPWSSFISAVLLSCGALSMCVHAYGYVSACRRKRRRANWCMLFVLIFCGHSISSHSHSHSRRAKKEHESVMNGTIMEHDILFVCFIWITPEIKCTHWNRRYLTHEQTSEWTNERTTEPTTNYWRQTSDE